MSHRLIDSRQINAIVVFDLKGNHVKMGTWQ